MLKVLLTDEMQSAILSAAPEDSALLTCAIIREFKDMEPVELPKHLEMLMSVFRPQIAKLKASYVKKCEDSKRRVQKHRKAIYEEATEEVNPISEPVVDDDSCNACNALHALPFINTKTKTKENIKTTSYQKEKPKEKEKGLALGFGGKSAYKFSAINSSMDIYSDKPEELIAADVCMTNSQHSINTWRKLARLSPYTFRDEVATLYSEMSAGEIPDNPSAVLTWRVQRAYKREGVQS